MIYVFDEPKLYIQRNWIEADSLEEAREKYEDNLYDVLRVCIADIEEVSRLATGAALVTAYADYETAKAGNPPNIWNWY